MPLNRGDVILAFVANIGQPGGKVRPALVVQSNYNNARPSQRNHHDRQRPHQHGADAGRNVGAT